MSPSGLCVKGLFTNVELSVNGRSLKRWGLVGICIGISCHWLSCGRKLIKTQKDLKGGSLRLREKTTQKSLKVSEIYQMYKTPPPQTPQGYVSSKDFWGDEPPSDLSHCLQMVWAVPGLQLLWVSIVLAWAFSDVTTFQSVIPAPTSSPTLHALLHQVGLWGHCHFSLSSAPSPWWVCSNLLRKSVNRSP